MMQRPNQYNLFSNGDNAETSIKSSHEWYVEHCTSFKNLNSTRLKFVEKIPTLHYGLGSDPLMNHSMVMTLGYFHFRLCWAVNNM